MQQVEAYLLIEISTSVLWEGGVDVTEMAGREDRHTHTHRHTQTHTDTHRHTHTHRDTHTHTLPVYTRKG